MERAKKFNACDNEDETIEIAGDATYISGDLLASISSKLKVNPIHTVIINSREQHNYYDVLVKNGFDREISAKTYVGDEDNLKQVVAEMLNAWDHRNKTIPLSIVLPLAQDHWDAFNFDGVATSELLDSSYGKVAILSTMQLLGMSDNFINAVLATMFPQSTNKVSPIISLEERYPRSGLNGYCLTPEVQADIQPLMTGADKTYTNDFTPVIPRIIAKDAMKFNVVSGMKFHHETGLTATENDLGSIRNTMMFNMSVTGGVVVTLNVPVLNESVRDGRFSTPTLIVPELWAGSIKSNRPQNNKQDEVDTLPEEQLNESARQIANRVRKTNRILKKKFEGFLHDQTIDKSDKEDHYCYPAPITNR